MIFQRVWCENSPGGHALLAKRYSSLLNKYCPRGKNDQLESYEVPELNEALDNKVFQIPLVASQLGQFCENFENTREINPPGPCDYIYLSLLFLVQKKKLVVNEGEKGSFLSSFVNIEKSSQ